MDMQSQISKINLFIVVNAIIFLLLYNIPVYNNPLLENMCIFKNIFGIECFNCGMTRAYLSIIQFDFNMALYYNKNVIIIFPFTIINYLYNWYRYICNTKNN